jgi:hypothetical protein
MKQKTLEEDYNEALKHFPDYDQFLERIAFDKGAEWKQEKVKEAIALLKQTTEYEVLESFRNKVDSL